MIALSPVSQTSAPFTVAEPGKLWIVIADRDTVRVFAREQNLFSCFQSFKPDLFSDEAETRGEQRQSHARMIKDAAIWLETELAAGNFDQIVLIATPDVIGEFHQLLSVAAMETVVTEIVRSMAEKSEIELAAELPKLVDTI